MRYGHCYILYGLHGVLYYQLGSVQYQHIHDREEVLVGSTGNLQSTSSLQIHVYMILHLSSVILQSDIVIVRLRTQGTSSLSRGTLFPPVEPFVLFLLCSGGSPVLQWLNLTSRGR